MSLQNDCVRKLESQGKMGVKFDIPILDVDVPRCVFAAVPNAHPHLIVYADSCL